VWNEVWDEVDMEWVPCDFKTLTHLTPSLVIGGCAPLGRPWERLRPVGRGVMAHVVAVEEGCVRDVTRRYLLCVS